MTWKRKSDDVTDSAILDEAPTVPPTDFVATGPVGAPADPQHIPTVLDKEKARLLAQYPDADTVAVPEAWLKLAIAELDSRGVRQGKPELLALLESKLKPQPPPHPAKVLLADQLRA